MPLPLPNLDTRRWTDLVEEGRALVPRYAPGWTDHNLHDPGITLMELLAWLVEQDVYRANRVPERHVRKFLALAGIEPEPPRAASVALSFSLAAGAASFRLPAGIVLAGGAGTGQPVRFRTTAPVRIDPAGIAAVQTWDGRRYDDVTRLWRDGVAFGAFGADPTGFDGDDPPALLLGFDRDLPAGEEVSLWLAVEGGDGAADQLARIREEARLQAEECRRPAPRAQCDREEGEGGEESEDAAVDPPPKLATVWERHDGVAWQPLDARDETRGLTLDGVVRLRAAGAATAVRLGTVPEPRFWVRCRAARGEPDEAPVLLDAALNAVVAEQRTAMALVAVGSGTGLPAQRHTLPAAPVADGALELWSDEPGGRQEWERRLDFDADTAGDRVFVLDAQRGEVRFGDGERGRVPAQGAAIVASYDVTAAAGGNLDAASTWRLAGADDVVNAALLGRDPADVQRDLTSIAGRGPARGGADAEDLAHAGGRAAEALWAHERLLELAPGRGGTLDGLDPGEVQGRLAPQRATTTLDFERLALDIPGTRVRRARAWASLDAAAPCLHAPGTVTVTLVNGHPAARPRPSRALLDAVERHLRRRKTLGTRLVVSGPEYVEVTVTARVRPLGGADAAAVQGRVLDALGSFLDPLRGGPAGRGWPFGRDVYRAELLALVDGVAGVDYVEALELAGADREADCGNVCVGPTELVVSGPHAVEVAP